MIERIKKYFAPRPSLDPSPREVEITPFFASIHAYTRLAETLPLPRLNELLSVYFDACDEEIQRQAGTLDKIVGDAVIAMFGAPHPQPDHALRACLTALHCQTRLAELRARWRDEGEKWPLVAQQLRMRIGLHTGEAIVGPMGPRAHPQYTMMGDTVNLAARLEAAASSYGVWTLCTAATRDACEHAAAGKILFRPLGPITVKGRAQPIEIFEPIALRENASDQLRECLALFASGLARYRAHAWPEAITLFEQSARLEPDQPGASPEITLNPSLLFLDLARTPTVSRFPPPP